MSYKSSQVIITSHNCYLLMFYPLDLDSRKTIKTKTKILSFYKQQPYFSQIVWKKAKQQYPILFWFLLLCIWFQFIRRIEQEVCLFEEMTNASLPSELKPPLACSILVVFEYTWVKAHQECQIQSKKPFILLYCLSVYNVQSYTYIKFFGNFLPTYLQGV